MGGPALCFNTYTQSATGDPVVPSLSGELAFDTVTCSSCLSAMLSSALPQPGSLWYSSRVVDMERCLPAKLLASLVLDCAILLYAVVADW